MYTPNHFKIEDLSEIHSLIKNYNFGIIFSQVNNGPIATHLPFMLDETKGKFGTLTSHMAKQNPQWKTWDDKTETLIVFQGPHFYVSPSWYKNQNTVPTWNYAAVHAYGIPKIIDNPEKVKPMLNELINNHEKNIKEKWDKDNTHEVIGKLLNGITAFEIEITKIEGKKKFNQNKSNDDIDKVLQNSKNYYPESYLEIEKYMKKKNDPNM